jgi:hypothetical protein
MTRIEEITSVSGRWRNQFGSELWLAADERGALHGQFRNSVGAPASSPLPVVGSCDPSPVDGSAVLAFVVDWTEAHCVTAWCGRYRAEDQTISATWIMTSEAPRSEEWKATAVGHDVFERSAETPWEGEV